MVAVAITTGSDHDRGREEVFVCEIRGESSKGQDSVGYTAAPN